MTNLKAALHAQALREFLIRRDSLVPCPSGFAPGPIERPVLAIDAPGMRRAAQLIWKKHRDHAERIRTEWSDTHWLRRALQALADRDQARG